MLIVTDTPRSGHLDVDLDSEIDSEIAGVFDELYDHIHRGRPLSALSATPPRLEPKSHASPALPNFASPRAERRVVTLRRGLLAVVGCVPLLVSPMLAHAAPPPPSAEPPPVIDDDVGFTGTSMWVPLLDEWLEVETSTGHGLDGRLVGQSPTEITLELERGRGVITVSKGEITGVRVPARRSRVSQSKRLKLVGGFGVAMAVVGLVATVNGVVFTVFAYDEFGDKPSFPVAVPMVMLPGLFMAGGGLAMAVVGHRKGKALEAASQGAALRSRIRWAPTLAADRNGGQAGLVLRF